MKTYLEYFKIDGVTNACITEETPGMFKPWVGGCGIHKSVPTVHKARQIIFDFLTVRLAQRIDEHKKQIESLQNIQKTLGNDVFNLRQYKTA